MPSNTELTKKRLNSQALFSAVLSFVVVLSIYYSLRWQAAAGEPSPSASALLWPGLLLMASTWYAMLRNALESVHTIRGPKQPPPSPVPQIREEKKPVVVAPPPPPPPPPPVLPQQPTAVQMLAALQRQGRLIDFLQEDLGSYEDSQIGAAVRSVHAGCKEAVAESMKLVPILNQEEGDTITVPVGFDQKAIRLTGNVRGNPPFRGVLRHKGWRDAKADLVVAPAEVEVNG